MKIAMKTKYLAGMLLLAAGTFAFTSCSDEDDYTIATGEIITTIETGEAEVTAISATTKGRVLDLSNYASSSYEVGVYYGTNQDPTTGGKKQIGSLDSTGVVTTSLTGLTKGTTYYYATYVTLQSKVTRYGDIKSFVATDAQIATAEATNVSACKATLNATSNGLSGLIGSDGQELEFGFKISVTEADVKDGYDYNITSTSSSISQNVEGLIPGNTYYYISYVQLGDGLVYGDVKSFTTQAQEMEYVDLGLSVLWAKCNLGAESETESGLLAGYGDKTGLNISTYLTDYTVSTDISGTDDDVVSIADIDGSSIMSSQTPTEDQISELIANTTQEWTTVDGVSGMKFTASNGNSIFLPATGYREGETVTGASVQGLYWSGNVNEISSDYGTTLNLTNGTATTGVSKRSLGLAIRPVRQSPEITPDNSKIVVGDLEGNGRIRIEIYNMYGSTASNAPINPDQIQFSNNMVVKFKLSGINDNLISGAPSTFMAGLEYADADWSPSYWSSFDNYRYDAIVTGDGEYAVWMETGGQTASGAVVFTIDIDQLGANLADISKVSAEITSIMFDVTNFYQEFDYSKTLFCNKDGDGTNGRIEIYNEYGETKGLGVDFSSMSFTGSMIVNFTISGIDGNLNSGADGSYYADMSFADASWDPSYWGGTSGVGATITGDGTYTVIAPLAGTSEGAVVWVIDIANLWKDLADPSLVKAQINYVLTPGK